MTTTPIYIKSLEIDNIKTFGEKVLLEFENPDGSLPQWTLIIGDNGLGKSTLLQLIAWMKPILPYDKHDTKGFIQTPIIMDEQNEVLTQLVRKKGRHVVAKISAIYTAQRSLNQKARKQVSKPIICKTEISIEVENETLVDVIVPKQKKNENDVFYKEEILIYAYSATRNLGKLNVGDPKLEDTISSFIAENTILYDANEILHTLKYAKLGNRGQAKKYQNYMDKVQAMLIEVLPESEKISKIDIIAPRIEKDKIVQQEIVLTTRHGENIPLRNFSLGYRTIISLTLDLSWRLINEYPESLNPLAEPAIVLIDEIDLHLHPLWQREIIIHLSKHFEKVQFIATAHSPLIVQSELNANHAVLKHSENGVCIENNPKDIDGWRIDQILTSEFFGLKSARGIKYEELIKERQKILSKSRLERVDELKLKKINKQLSDIPTGENPEEIANRKLISELVEKIKKDIPSIKL